MELKYGKFSIPNLMLYLMFGQGIVFLAYSVRPSIIYNFIFDWEAITSGEIWRLVTFIFMPTSYDPIWFLLAILIYYSIGSQLERVIGTFHFNFYYFISMISVIIVSAVLGFSGNIAMYINTSLFLSFATLMPDTTFYLYFIIPIKAKFLIIFYFILLAIDVANGGVPRFILIVASLAGYLIYFAIPAMQGKKIAIRRTGSYENALRHQQSQRGKSPAGSPPQKRGNSAPIKVAFHKCNECGKTELDDPNLEFRYCSTCNKEYCTTHLKNHQH